MIWYFQHLINVLYVNNRFWCKLNGYLLLNHSFYENRFKPSLKCELSWTCRMASGKSEGEVGGRYTQQLTKRKFVRSTNVSSRATKRQVDSLFIHTHFAIDSFIFNRKYKLVFGKWRTSIFSIIQYCQLWIGLCC